MNNIDLRHPSPFRPSPHGLWSLWAIMLKQAALEFGRGLVDLRMLEAVCEQLLKASRPMTPDESVLLFQHATQVVGNLKRVCILTDLDDVLPQIDRIGPILQRQDIAALKSHAEHLRTRLYDELQNEFYLQIDRVEVQFYDKPALFGPKVAGKFKAAANDITQAGNCIALRQPDACVFHLMRAMEIAVRQLGRRLGVVITPQTTWRQLTGAMDAKIKALADKTMRQKNKKNDWEEARTNLHHVGSVWRNNTMHPATSYTRSQARDVFDAVRVFINALCEL